MIGESEKLIDGAVGVRAPCTWARAPSTAVVALALLAWCPTGAAHAQAVTGQTPTTLRVGPQRPDLVRYNRVEALSVGVRGQLRLTGPTNPLSVTTTARLGVADLEPNVLVEVSQESLRRRTVLRLYHDLAAIDQGARPFGVANSVLALTAGRDDGDYYRRLGASVEVTPPTARPRVWLVRGFVERHRPAHVETDFALAGLGREGWRFRDNLVAAPGWEYGLATRLAPRWGTDPARARALLDVTASGALGDAEYVRSSVTAHVEAPLAPRLFVGLTVGGGAVWADPSPQRGWYLGGPRTLRAYVPRTLGGEAFWRARGRIQRAFPFGRASIFSDLGWAGARPDFGWRAARASVGLGLSILDDLIHVDAAHSVRGPERFRIDAYLDQGFGS